MNLSILHGIVDNDPKGSSGRGTIHYMKISVDGALKEYVEWGLLEELNGTFDPESMTKKYTDAYKAFLDEQANREREEKKAALETRTASIKIDDALNKIMDDVIASETKAVAEYKAGKEKALNSLVGKVIGQIRKNKLSVEADAFGITTTLKQKLS